MQGGGFLLGAARAERRWSKKERERYAPLPFFVGPHSWPAETAGGLIPSTRSDFDAANSAYQPRARSHDHEARASGRRCAGAGRLRSGEDRRGALQEADALRADTARPCESNAPRMSQFRSSCKKMDSMLKAHGRRMTMMLWTAPQRENECRQNALTPRRRILPEEKISVPFRKPLGAPP